MFASDAWGDAVPPRVRVAAIVLTMVLAAALRLIGLDKPLYIDEIVTITVAAQPLDRMAAVMRQIDASPALFPLLLHAWMQVSTADAWVRLLPVLFGTLAVPVCALVTARAFGWMAGIAAGFVMAIAPAHVHYAQYVRGYSLFTLLAALHVWLFMVWMDKAVCLARGHAVLLVLLTAALLYTHYLSLLLLGAEGLYVLYAWRLRARGVRWGLAVAVGGLLFLPGVPLLLHNIEHDRVRNMERPAPPAVVKVAPNLLAELSVGQRILGFDDARIRRATLAAAALVFPALLLVGVVHAARRRPDMLVLLALVTFAPLIVYIGSGRRLVAVRFFVPFMIGYLALIGVGLASLRRWQAAVAGAALLCLSAVPLEHYYRDFTWSYDHRAVAREIARRLQPGDGLVVVHPYEAFFYRWYLPEKVPITGLVFTALEDQGSYVIKPPPMRFAQAAARVTAAAHRHERLWFVGQSGRSFSSDVREEQQLVRWMEARFRRLADLEYVTAGDPVIRLYESGAAAEPQ